MNTLHKILLGVFGGGGFTATTSWYVYDNVINPTLIKSYKDAWNPITIKLNKFDSTNSTETPYSGSSCFERFFGGIKIEKMGTGAATTADSTSSVKFDTLFKDSKSDIYGCAVGEGKNFYEVVLKNEEIGFVTWYDGGQKNWKTFKLEKSNDKWEIKAGIWTAYTTNTPTNHSNFTDQIKSKTGEWAWWFMMDQTTAKGSTNMQEWKDVFEWKSKMAFYEKNKGWNYNNFSIANRGKIPNFSKVTTLDDFCEKEGATRKPKPTEENDEEKTLKAFCIV